MGAVKITRQQALQEWWCQNGHTIEAGQFYCHVDLAPGQPRRYRSDWGVVDRYCEPCATEKYARYRSILAKLLPGQIRCAEQQQAAPGHKPEN